jgi:hypothetical protein
MDIPSIASRWRLAQRTEDKQKETTEEQVSLDLATHKLYACAHTGAYQVLI